MRFFINCQQLQCKDPGSRNSTSSLHIINTVLYKINGISARGLLTTSGVKCASAGRLVEMRCEIWIFVIHLSPTHQLAGEGTSKLDKPIIPYTHVCTCLPTAYDFLFIPFKASAFSL